MKTKVIAISVTVIVSFVLGYFSIYQLFDYGWMVFVFLPIFIGFTPGYVLGRDQNLPFSKYRNVGFTTLFIALSILILAALEGVICIVMVLPLFLLLTLLGTWLAYISHRKNWFRSRKNTALVLALSGLSFLSLDYAKSYDHLFPVTTEVLVDAPIEKVWHHVITFDSIAPPTDWVLKTGISYPTHATIKGRGEGAIRYCNFTTGSFVEPITKWQEPTLLQFDVLEQPIPMTEVNPFWNVHPPHLDGYFESKKGQFQLVPISQNKTLLRGTTFYQLAIGPQFYWKQWSDFIIHLIHKRVLNHIKSEAENK